MTELGGAGAPSTTAVLWRDLLDYLSEGATVLSTDDSRTIVFDRRNHIKEVLAFGPAEWFQFVTNPSVANLRHADDELTLNPPWAIDELWLALGSKGSPLALQGGRLVRE